MTKAILIAKQQLADCVDENSDLKADLVECRAIIAGDRALLNKGLSLAMENEALRVRNPR